MADDPVTQKGAVISSCEQYRYVLWRQWDATKPTALFVMLNPSTADHEYDDATIRRCIRFAREWGYGMLRVVNLFALRSRYPSTLFVHEDPVGPQNDNYLIAEAKAAKIVIMAWGANKAAARSHRDRNVKVILAVHATLKLHYLRKTCQGHPEHPLRLPAHLMPQVWMPEPEEPEPITKEEPRNEEGDYPDW